MARDNLRKLKRADLLELLLEQTKEREALRAQLDAALDELAQLHAERESGLIRIEGAGTLSDVAMSLSGVCAANDEAARILQEADDRADAIVADAQAEADAVLRRAKRASEVLLEATQAACMDLLDQAQEEVDALLREACS